MISKQVKSFQLAGMLAIILGAFAIGLGWWIDQNAANSHNAGSTLMAIGMLVTFAGIVIGGVGAMVAWWKTE